jgi:muconolactone D-isomerase
MSEHDISRQGSERENTVDYLVKAAPTQRFLDLSAAEVEELIARERTVATALMAEGAITWIWRLPGTTTSVAIWNAESAETLDAHLETLPIFPYQDIEITELAPHPAFPAPLRAAAD